MTITEETLYGLVRTAAKFAWTYSRLGRSLEQTLEEIDNSFKESFIEPLKTGEDKTLLL